MNRRIRSQPLLLTSACILAASCASTEPAEIPDWKMSVSALPTSITLGPLERSEDTAVDAAAEREDDTPRVLRGKLLARTEAKYTLIRQRDGKEDVWDLTFRTPEMPTAPSTGWVTMTSRPKAPPRRFVHRQALPYRGKLTVFENGDEQGTGDIVLPLAFMGRALFEACEACADMTADEHAESGRAGEPDDAHTIATASFVAFSLTFARSPLLRSVVEEVVAWPDGGLFSDPEVRIGFEPELFDAEPVATKFGPGYTVPVRVNINAEPSFYGQITVVEPQGVLLATAGIVEVVGFSADRPSDEVRLSLSGADMPKTGRLDEEGIDRLLAIEPELKLQIDEVEGPEDGPQQK